MNLRKAQESDLLTVFNWANDPIVRTNAFNSKTITLEEHTKWYLEKIKNVNTLFLILETDGQPVGQIRYEITGDEIIISYLIASHYRGKGLGREILKLGENYLIRSFFLKVNNKVVGYVKKDNIASQKAFLKCGFLMSEIRNQRYPDSFKFEKKIIYHEIAN